MRPEPQDLHATPRAHLAEAVERYGLHATVDTCLVALEGAKDLDLLPVPLTYLGGAHARRELEKAFLVERGQDHWPRTWGARGLQYVWAGYAAPVVVLALSDGHWRVREMAAKVVAKHEVGEAAEALLRLVSDPEPRVQVAAMRAAGEVGESEHVRVIESTASEDRAVQIAASSALRALRRRLDAPDR